MKYRAGSKLFVSTRADGSFEGETSEGVPIVNKDTYECDHIYQNY